MFSWKLRKKASPQTDLKFHAPQRQSMGPISSLIIEQVKNEQSRYRFSKSFLKLLALLIGLLLLFLFFTMFASANTVLKAQQTDNTPSTPTPSLPRPSTSPITTTVSYPSTSPSPSPTTPSAPKQIIIGSNTLVCDTAVVYNEWITGLRFTPSLPSNGCLLYILGTPDYYPFWAKDMNYPMDIIFIGSGNVVNDLAENIPPCTNNCNMIKPENPITYAIEVNGGYVGNHFIRIGDPVRFVY